MNIYCVKGVAAYHAATPFTQYENVLMSMIKTNFIIINGILSAFVGT
jgi:hypothetical protein